MKSSAKPDRLLPFKRNFCELYRRARLKYSRDFTREWSQKSEERLANVWVNAELFFSIALLFVFPQHMSFSPSREGRENEIWKEFWWQISSPPSRSACGFSETTTHVWVLFFLKEIFMRWLKVHEVISLQDLTLQRSYDDNEEEAGTSFWLINFERSLGSYQPSKCENCPSRRPLRGSHKYGSTFTFYRVVGQLCGSSCHGDCCRLLDIRFCRREKNLNKN